MLNYFIKHNNICFIFIKNFMMIQKSKDEKQDIGLQMKKSD